MGFVANFIRCPTVQKLWQSVKIWQSYKENLKVGTFLRHSVNINDKQTNRRRWKHPTLFATLRRWLTGLSERVVWSLWQRDAVTQSRRSFGLYAARHWCHALDVFLYVRCRVKLVYVNDTSTVEYITSVERTGKVVLVYPTRQLPANIITIGVSIKRCTDNWPIISIGHFAENRYRPISTLVSADSL